MATARETWMFILRLVLLLSLLVLWPLSSVAFEPQVSTEFMLNQASSYCLGCHDGVLATEVHRGHPVDSNYLFAQMKSRGKLKPPAALDPAIYLKDGQTACVSCHHPESQNGAKLVLSNDGSRLCLAWHNL